MFHDLTLDRLEGYWRVVLCPYLEVCLCICSTNWFQGGDLFTIVILLFNRNPETFVKHGRCSG